MIKTNTVQIIGVSLVAWFLVLQILSWITKFNILKLIVLVGTFALAMAFAGNDLVNFIGVPLAGKVTAAGQVAPAESEDASDMDLLSEFLLGKLE